MSELMYLNYFTKEDTFPFFIQYGFHQNPMYLHSHADFVELVVVLEGEAIHQVEEEQYPIQKGDVFVIGPHTSHGFLRPGHLKICNLMFRKELLSHSEHDIKTSPGYHSLFILEPYLSKEEFFTSRLKLAPGEYQMTFQLITDLIWEYEHKPCGWMTMVSAMFMELVVRLSRAYEKLPIQPKGSVLSLSTPVAYMELHYTESLTMEYLAALAGFSPRHFSRLFHTTYELTPFQYLTNLRLQKASTLLKTTALSISDIADQCGFEDSNYFSRQFKNHYHRSPREFRKNG